MASPVYTLITGASAGFGKALAVECARRRMNLILVALPGDDLLRFADSLRTGYGVAVFSIETDLCREGGCRKVFGQVQAAGLQVNMLVNNAGIGSTALFGERSPAQYEQQIKLNVLATTLMTHLFLDALKRNRPAYILNVSSLACFYALPHKQVYGATKSFVYYFSRSLCKELKPDGVHVSVLCPGGLHTNREVIARIRAGNYLSRRSSMAPEQAAPVALDGLLAHKEVIVPGRLNRCFLVLNVILPGFIKAIIMNAAMSRLTAGCRPARCVAESTPVPVLAPLVSC